MPDPISCRCGAAPVICWLGSPKTYRVRCSRCDCAVARQATEAEAVALWDAWASGAVPSTHETGARA